MCHTSEFKVPTKKVPPVAKEKKRVYIVEIHGSHEAPLNDCIPDLQKNEFFSNVLQWWQISKNKNYQDVYLDDADGFYFWTC